MKICPVCGEPVTSKRSDAVYCSTTCRVVASFVRKHGLLLVSKDTKKAIDAAEGVTAEDAVKMLNRIMELDPMIIPVLAGRRVPFNDSIRQQFRIPREAEQINILWLIITLFKNSGKINYENEIFVLEKES